MAYGKPNFGPGYRPGLRADAQLRASADKVARLRLYLQREPTNTAVWRKLRELAEEAYTLAKEEEDVRAGKPREDARPAPAGLPPEDAGEGHGQGQRVDT